MAKIQNTDELDKLIESGIIGKTKHPSEDLFILNYTREAGRDAATKVPIDKNAVWDSALVRQCRGLIIDSNYNIKARPFEKFFNFEELKDLSENVFPKETFDLPYIITEKMDGSLGILYWMSNGKPALATRSTFESEQAIRGTKILNDKYDHLIENLPKDKTFLFEIIYPENKMVVDYGNDEDLYLLAVIDIETGEEESFENYPEFKHPEIISGNWKDIRNEYQELGKDKNREGFVVKFSNGCRIKLKFENYFKMHYYTGQLSRKNIIKLIVSGQNTKKQLDEICKEISNIDPEFLAHVNSIIKETNDEYEIVKNTAINLTKFPNDFENKIAWASYVKDQGDYAPAIFILSRMNGEHPESYYVTDAMRRRESFILDKTIWKIVEKRMLSNRS